MNNRIKLFLITSALLNLLLVGIVLGQCSHYFIMSPPPPLPHSMFNSEALSQLPPDKRKLFEDAMTRTQEDTAELQEKLQNIRKDMEHILKAESFDAAEYLKQAQRLHKASADRKMQMAKAIAEVAKQYTPEERAMLADAIRRPEAPPMFPAGAPASGNSASKSAY